MSAAPATRPAETAAGSRRASRPGGWVARHWRIPVVVVMIALVYLNLRGRLPGVGAVGAALRSAEPGWIAVAAVAQAISLAMFAYQQRSLLHAVGVRMTVRRAMAVTYARCALMYSMPAGGAVSAGFAFDQYRRGGASTDRAAAVTVLSGIVSILGLAGLYLLGLAGLVVARPDRTVVAHPVAVSAAAALLAIGLARPWWRRWIRAAAREAEPAVTEPAATEPADAEPVNSVPAEAAPGGAAPSRRARLRASVRTAATDTVRATRSLRARDWFAGSGFAAGAWLFDAVCLASTAAAFRLPVGLFAIAGLYLGVQLVLQLPVTPGGIGLIETALLAGLTRAGAPAAPAAAAILAYRVLSCWLIIPLGGVAWLRLRSRPAGPPPRRPAATP